MPPRPGLDAYLICATPRTGSTLLCSLLDSSGVAGHPASYFRRESLDAYADSWAVPRPRDGLVDEAFLGLELPDGRQLASTQRRQADALNADWISRFTSSGSGDPAAP